MRVAGPSTGSNQPEAGLHAARAPAAPLVATRRPTTNPMANHLTLMVAKVRQRTCRSFSHCAYLRPYAGGGCPLGRSRVRFHGRHAGIRGRCLARVVLHEKEVPGYER